MRLNNIHIINFKCFDDIKFDFHPQMNVLVGVNGTGKSSILEAIRIAIGSLFLGVDKYEDKIASPNISQDDVRLVQFEQQYPVNITAVANISNFAIDNENIVIDWKRSLETKGGRTTHKDAKEIKNASVKMQQAIRDNMQVNIPILAYFSTERYKKEKKDYGVEADGSRLRGYYNSLDTLTNIKFFQNLYYTETLDSLQKGRESIMLKSINKAVKECINCLDLYYDFKQAEIILVQNDRKIPIHLLSDGVRSILSLVMEIAFRACLLNPHLQADAPIETEGIVLIDEIDLHLHPEWQMHILSDLQRAFPNIQFVVTTHAPLVIGSVKEGRIYSISSNQIFDFPLQNGRDANYILNEMGSAEMDVEIKDMIEHYHLLIENGRGKEQEALYLRTKLDGILGINHPELVRADLLLNFF